MVPSRVQRGARIRGLRGSAWTMGNFMGDRHLDSALTVQPLDMNLCPQRAAPIPKSVDESSSPVEYCLRIDAALALDVRKDSAEQWLP